MRDHADALRRTMFITVRCNLLSADCVNGRWQEKMNY
jgi:hypothetical protein